MAKLRLSIKSTTVLDVYGIVDVIFNGATLVASKQLSATVENLEYNIAGIDGTSNTLKISLLNHKAIDANGDNNYTGPDDILLIAQLSSLQYSIDDINYVTLLPQVETSYTIPSGPHANEVLILTENVTEFKSFGLDSDLIFNSDGIVYASTPYAPNTIGVKIKVLENGNVQDFVNGKTYDPDGNELGAP